MILAERDVSQFWLKMPAGCWTGKAPIWLISAINKKATINNACLWFYKKYNSQNQEAQNKNLKRIYKI